MEIKKYILIPNSDWRTLKNESTQPKKIKDLSMPQVIKKPIEKYNTQLGTHRPKSKLNSENIHDFINKAKNAVGREKILPDSLKQARFLSDVFTEKRNQLNFRSALKKINRELMDQENRQFIVELERYQIEQLKKKREANHEKIVLGKRLKNEILDMKSKKKREKVEETLKEREELSKIHSDLQNDENQLKIQALEMKKKVDEMHQQDIQAKHRDLEICENVEKEDAKISNTQSKFIYLADDIRKNIDKSVNIVIPPKVNSTDLNKEKEIIRRYYDLKPVKKSKLEKKRDLYSRLLKQERVQGYVFQMEDLLLRKMSVKKEKDTECEQRYKNMKVTNKFQQLQHHKILDRVKEYRKIWNHQCIEKKQLEEKQKKEDIDRREKLVQKIRHEDEEYLADASALLNEYQKQDKICMPIIKCIKAATSQKKKNYR